MTNGANRVRSRRKTACARGQRYRLRQILSIVPNQLHSQPDQATRQAAFGQSLGYERVREEKRAAWQNL